MVDKKLKPGIWGDPPSFRDRLNPVPMRPSNATTRVNSILTTPPETPPINSRRFHAGSAAWQQAATDSCDACGATVASAPKCHVPTKEAFAAAAKANGPGPAHGTPSGGPLRGSDVPRTNIGIFGRMNAGKSSLMNRLARADVSIVDSTPGTTADTKITLMELHSAGPVKLFDTAGIDEEGVLGDKKRRKVLSTVKECDVAAVVVSLPQLATRLGGGGTNFSQDALHAALEWEKVLLDKARTADAQPVLVFNLAAGSTTPFLSKHAEQELRRSAAAVLNPDRCLPELEVPLAEAHASGKLTAFLERAAAEAGAAHHVPCLPEQYLSEDAMVFLNIPMDAETPTMRLLRPQALVQEEAIRAFATTVAYRMNLDHARR